MYLQKSKPSGRRFRIDIQNYMKKMSNSRLWTYICYQLSGILTETLINHDDYFILEYKPRPILIYKLLKFDFIRITAS